MENLPLLINTIWTRDQLRPYLELEVWDQSSGILVRAVIPQQTHLPPLRGAQHRDARCPCISHPSRAAGLSEPCRRTSEAVHPKLWSKLKDERKEVIRLNRKGCHRQAELDPETETAGKPTALGWQEAGGWRPRGAEGRYPPLLAVLPHAHPAPVPRGGVAAGPLPHLEADPTRGAAGRPRGPGGPASVPAGRSNRVTGVNLREAQPLSAPAPKFTRGIPPRGPLTYGLRRPREQEPWEAMQCTVSGTGYFEVHPRPRTWFSSQKRKLESQVLHVLANNLKTG